MPVHVIRILLLCVAACTCHAADQPADQPRTRREFAKAMSKLKEGMSEAEVLSLLGRPDDIRTQHDPGGVSTTGTREIWRYGTSGHLTTATLGQVYIDDKGRVQYFYGQGDPLPD